MSYIQSDYIKVFPLSKNRPTDRNARLFYENNIANIIRQLIDVEGFIIEPQLDSDCKLTCAKNSSKLNIQLDKCSLKFNLYGYYFNIGSSEHTVKLTDIDLPTDATSSYDVYAILPVDNNSNEIYASDVDNEYAGLFILTTLKDVEPQFDAPVDTNTHQLKLFTFTVNKSDDEYTIQSVHITKDSYVKFTGPDLTVARIDGRPITE